MLMIRPSRAFIIGRAAARVNRNVPRRLMLITASHWSSFMRTITLSRVMPALLTRMFSPPHSFDDLVDHLADALAVGHVAGDRLGRAAGGADGGDRVGQASRR